MTLLLLLTGASGAAPPVTDVKGYSAVSDAPDDGAAVSDAADDGSTASDA